jgi:hypothetical protein
MALTSGTRLGPYEIESPLGAGGMGEVYRALDTRLNRTVAIKILPAHLSDNSEAKRRFEREARAISSLNHPNICTLHDVGHQSGTDYLVMPMQGLQIQLVIALDRYEAHLRPLDCLRNRLGINVVALVRLYVRLDILRRHQPHLVPLLSQSPP